MPLCKSLDTRYTVWSKVLLQVDRWYANFSSVSQRWFSLVWSSTFAGRVGFSCSSFRGIKVQSQRLYHGAFRGDQWHFRWERKFLPGSGKVNRECCKGCQSKWSQGTEAAVSTGWSFIMKGWWRTEAEANDMAKVPYRALVGMLSYIMGHTKPDIAYALNVLSRYCNNPG